MNNTEKKIAPPEAVMKAIREAFPREAEEIIESLRWHPGDAYYSFNRWGMHVGVELDGYIHT